MGGFKIHKKTRYNFDRRGNLARARKSWLLFHFEQNTHTMEGIDQRAIDTIRTLSADIVQKAKSGHPGAPMGMAAIAHVLFSRHLRFNPKNPKWVCLIIHMLTFQ